MYTLIRSNTFKTLITQQAPALSISFFIASTFYKFGSFATECVAFLATWFVIDFVIVQAFALFEKKQPASTN